METYVIFEIIRFYPSGGFSDAVWIGTDQEKAIEKYNLYNNDDDLYFEHYELFGISKRKLYGFYDGCFEDYKIGE